VTSTILIAVGLAGAFFALHRLLRKRGDEATYNRVTVIGAAIGILVAFGFFAAIQLGFITDHAL
jgi:hypothetical protein